MHGGLWYDAEQMPKTNHLPPPFYDIPDHSRTYIRPGKVPQEACTALDGANEARSRNMVTRKVVSVA